MKPMPSRTNSSFGTPVKKRKLGSAFAGLMMISLIAGCATQTNVSESCPVWVEDNTFYPSEEVISVMDRGEREQVAQINQEIETFCNTE